MVQEQRQLALNIKHLWQLSLDDSSFCQTILICCAGAGICRRLFLRIGRITIVYLNRCTQIWNTVKKWKKAESVIRLYNTLWHVIANCKLFSKTKNWKNVCCAVIITTVSRSPMHIEGKKDFSSQTTNSHRCITKCWGGDPWAGNPLIKTLTKLKFISFWYCGTANEMPSWHTILWYTIHIHHARTTHQKYPKNKSKSFFSGFVMTTKMWNVGLSFGCARVPRCFLSSRRSQVRCKHLLAGNCFS